jgi:hypothetical protein
MLLISKLQIAQFQHCPNYLPNLRLFLFRKAYFLHGFVDFREVLQIVDIAGSVIAALFQIVVFGRLSRPVLAGCSEGIKSVKGALVGCH